MANFSRRDFLAAGGAAMFGIAGLPLLADVPFSRTGPPFRIAGLDIVPGGRGESVIAMNDHGQIVGVAEEKAYVWEKGRIHHIDPLPNTHYLSPRAINNAGQVVGTAYHADFNGRHAFLWENGKTQDLGMPLGEFSEASDINERGQVIGKSYRTILKNKVEQWIDSSYNFIWNERAGFQKLEKPVGSYLDGLSAINDKGQITGSSETLGVEEKKAKMAALPPDRRPYEGNLIPGGAFIWQAGVTTSLRLAEAWSSGGADINNQGEIIGGMSLYPDADEILTSGTRELAEIENAMRHSHHFFLWKSGQAVDLGESGNDHLATRPAINNAGDAVFSYIDLSQTKEVGMGRRSILYQRGTRHRLEGFAARDSGWLLSNAVDINNRGQILGTGFYQNRQRTFLLTPT